MIPSLHKRTLAVLTFLAIATGPARADIIVSSVPVWNGTDNTGVNFGTPSTVTMGETFTNTPGYTALTGFTFYVKNNTSNPFQFTGSVYRWTGTTVTGSALFTSAPVTVNGNGISPGYQALTVSTGSVGLTAGGQYVMLFSIGSGAIGINSSWGQAGGAGSSFFGGSYVYTNSAVAPGSAFTIGSTVSAFTATFTPAAIPEPSPLLLGAAASALAAIPAAVRRLRRAG